MRSSNEITKKKLLVIFATLFALVSLGQPVFAAIDLQADLNRIISGIQRFDANSASTSSVKTMADVNRVFSNNSSILNEIKSANAAFARDLNSAKKYIPSRDTKDSPAFSTLMNLSKGYEEWLKYQNINQSNAQKCISKANGSYSTFSKCSISLLPKTLENERIGMSKLQAAIDAWKQWQRKYGYA